MHHSYLAAFAAGVMVLGATIEPSGANEAAITDHTQPVSAYFEANIVDWIESREVVDAIKAQNRETIDLDAAEIDRLDQAWRAEMGSEDNHRPTVEAMMEREISRYLKARQREADWMVVEIIVMDAQGLNVGLSTPSSDFWQGDEAKHQKTFQAGTDAVFVDAVEYEAETRLLISQANRTIFDPATGEPIGAVTVSLNMNKL